MVFKHVDGDVTYLGATKEVRANRYNEYRNNGKGRVYSRLASVNPFYNIVHRQPNIRAEDETLLGEFVNQYNNKKDYAKGTKGQTAASTIARELKIVDTRIAKAASEVERGQLSVEKVRTGVVAISRETAAATIKASLFNAAFNFGATLAIGAVVSLIQKVANATQEAKEHAEALSQAMSENLSENSQNAKTISELNGEYQKLSKGVDNTGQNVSLTTEEYDRYKEIISQVSDIMPNLTTYFNAQGEAIGFTQGKIKDLNKEYEEYQKAAANKLLNEGVDGASVKDIDKNFDNTYLLTRSRLADLDKLSKVSQEDISDYYTKVKDIFNSNYNVYLKKIMKESGFDFEAMKTDPELYGNFQNWVQSKAQSVRSEQQNVVNQMMNLVNSSLNDYGSEYWNLSNDDKNAARSIVSLIDGETAYNLGFSDDVKRTASINTLLKNVKGKSKEYSEALNILSTSVNDFNGTVTEYRQKYDDALKMYFEAFGIDVGDKGAIEYAKKNGFSGKKILRPAGFNLEDTSEYDNKIADKIGDKIKDTDVKKIEDSLNQKEISVMLEPDFEIDENTTLDNVKKQIDEIIKKRKIQEEVTVTLKTKIDRLNNTGIADTMKVIYNAFKSQEKDKVIDYSDIESLSNSLVNCIPNLEDYVKVLMDGNTTQEKALKTLSDLTNAYLDFKVAHGELDDVEEQYIASMLNEQGVQNSAVLAHNLCENARKRNTAATLEEQAASLDLQNITEEEKKAFLDQAEAIGLTTVAQNLLASAQETASDKMTENLRKNVLERYNLLETELEGITTIEAAYNLLAQKKSSAKTGDSFTIPTPEDYESVKKEYGEQGANEILSAATGTFTQETYTQSLLNGFKDRIEKYKAELDKAKTDITFKPSKDSTSSKENSADKAADTAAKKLREAKEAYDKKIKDINEKQYNADFEYSLNAVTRALEKYTTALERLKTAQDGLYENDFIGKIDIIGQKYGEQVQYSDSLRTEMERLLAMTPETSDAWEKLASSLEDISSKYFESQRAVIEHRNELFETAADANAYIATLTEKSGEAAKKEVERIKNVLDNGSSVRSIFDTDPTRIVPKSAVEKERAENKKLEEEQKRYQQRVQEIRQRAVDEAKAYEDQQRQEERDEALTTYKEAIEDAKTTFENAVSDSENSVATSIQNTTELFKQSVDDMNNYAKQNSPNLKLDVDVNGKASSNNSFTSTGVSKKATGGITGGLTEVNEGKGSLSGREGYIGKDGKLHWFNDGVQLFDSDEPVRVINARDMQNIIDNTGYRYFNEPIGDLESVSKYANGNTDVSITSGVLGRSKKKIVSNDIVNDILNELNDSFDSLKGEITVEPVKNAIYKALNDKSFFDKIGNGVENGLDKETNDVLDTVYDEILNNSSWESFGDDIKNKFIELGASEDGWNEWISNPNNAMRVIPLLQDGSVNSWDLLGNTPSGESGSR